MTTKNTLQIYNETVTANKLTSGNIQLSVTMFGAGTLTDINFGYSTTPPSTSFVNRYFLGGGAPQGRRVPITPINRPLRVKTHSTRLTGHKKSSKTTRKVK